MIYSLVLYFLQNNTSNSSSCNTRSIAHDLIPNKKFFKFVSDLAILEYFGPFSTSEMTSLLSHSITKVQFIPGLLKMVFYLRAVKEG